MQQTQGWCTLIKPVNKIGVYNYELNVSRSWQISTKAE